MAEVLSIEELRSRIDVIDDQLVRLLNVRVACAVEVGRLKHEAGAADLSARARSRRCSTRSGSRRRSWPAR